MKPLLSALVGLLAAVLTPQLEAGPIYPDCTAGTLQSYIQSSGCILGGGSGGVVVFSGFAFPTPQVSPDDTPVEVLDPSQIELTPASSGLGGSFDFSGDFFAPAGDTVTYDIDYFLLIDPGPILGGGRLLLDPTGDVSVTESICADSFFATDSSGASVCQTNTQNGLVDSVPQSLLVDNSNPPFSLSDQIDLNPPAFDFATVETEIVLTGGDTGASSGGVVEGDNVYSAPEPVASLLCFGGLIAIGIFRRYNK
jgi:hypothetical protein